jgi:hypothetical protein
MRAVVDNDILLKGACYGLLPVFMACVPGDGAVGILGASRFVVPKMIVRNQLQGNPASATACFAAFVAENEVVEPSGDEQQMAAVLEAVAQQMALNLDAGESQLVAILVFRCLPWMLTGDKRAIVSIERLLDTDTRLKVVAGKIKCLEQLVADALAAGDDEQIREAICAEPSVDITLSICYSCRSSSAGSVGVTGGLASYIADLSTKASRVLAT